VKRRLPKSVVSSEESGEKIRRVSQNQINFQNCHPGLDPGSIKTLRHVKHFVAGDPIFDEFTFYICMDSGGRRNDTFGVME